MGRGVNAGGGQSSLGYLFGSGETAAASNIQRASNQGQPANGGHTPSNVHAASPPSEKQIPAGIPGTLTNNYHRAEGQNCGNFLTVHPLSTFC
ncbi:protein SPIRAL1-like 1 [Arachis ipaensis]|uniref:Protein SPIRAL1-like n=1 Tax=Arachis hypogaea TaxID=3818 RepID=A0A445CCU1_ARAHY|nr:protein SPIRAL1-like 1 [Arachis ipaensis]RYR48764.1 hypothetical protein Ahy_A07g034840 [Arachis hypogaea]